MRDRFLLQKKLICQSLLVSLAVLFSLFEYDKVVAFNSQLKNNFKFRCNNHQLSSKLSILNHGNMISSVNIDDSDSLVLVDESTFHDQVADIRSKPTSDLISEFFQSIKKSQALSENNDINTLNNIGLGIIRSIQLPKMKDEAWRL